MRERHTERQTERVTETEKESEKERGSVCICVVCGGVVGVGGWGWGLTGQWGCEWTHFGRLFVLERWAKKPVIVQEYVFVLNNTCYIQTFLFLHFLFWPRTLAEWSLVCSV